MVAELIEAGLVVEAGAVESEGGRPRILLEVGASRFHVIGVDVGETHVRVERFDLALTELARVDIPMTPGRYEPEVRGRRIVAGLAGVGPARAGHRDAELLGVGIGVPGHRGGPAGVLVHCQTIGWDAVPLEAMLREVTELPLFVDNGATTMGQAEMWFGGGREAADTVFLLIGSGVGASILVGGMPYRGASTSAGRVGAHHRGDRRTPLPLWGQGLPGGLHRRGVGDRPLPRGRRCPRPRPGQRLGQRPGQRPGDRCRRRGGRAPADPGDRRAAGAARAPTPSDRPRRRHWPRGRSWTTPPSGSGSSIGNLINLFNPERVIIGGWAGLLLAQGLMPQIREAAREHSLHYPFSRTTIELGRLGPDAVARGAATLPVVRFLNSGGAPAGSASVTTVRHRSG